MKIVLCSFAYLSAIESSIQINLFIPILKTYMKIVTFGILQEKYWEDHPGHAVPLMKPKFYGGPWKVERGEVPAALPEP